MLTAQNYAGEKRREHHHYLKGTVFCGSCGSRLFVQNATGKTGRLYRYFVRSGRHGERNDCTRRAMPIDHVEYLVEEQYR